MFFKFYLEWDWSSEPIHLTEISIDKVTFPIPEELRYMRNPNDLMPIITPAFPHMNSTYNVSQFTKKAIFIEFEKALLIIEHLINKTGSPDLSWKRLFKKFNFFKSYTHFI